MLGVILVEKLVINLILEEPQTQGIKCESTRWQQTWKHHQTWWAWQGAGWFLMLLMLLTLTMGLPAMAGPVLGS